MKEDSKPPAHGARLKRDSRLSSAMARKNGVRLSRFRSGERHPLMTAHGSTWRRIGGVSMMSSRTVLSGLALPALFFFTLACSDQRIETPQASDARAVLSGKDDAREPEIAVAATPSDEDRGKRDKQEHDRVEEKAAGLDPAQLPGRAPAPDRLRALGYMEGGSTAAHLHSYRWRGPAHPHARQFSPPPAFDTEQYDHVDEEGFLTVAERPLSTFSIDVDTASYSNVRRFLHEGRLPPMGAVRIEEMINYFAYDYPAGTNERPFGVATEIARAPWNPEHQLILIGLKTEDIALDEVPPRNLVFLIDVSGSMTPENKLGLVKTGLSQLAGTLRPEDHVAIVVYAGAAGTVLEPTSGRNKAAIIESLSRLQAGGSTNGAGGIRQAYDMARRHFDSEGINRVILATDGDFNVGTTSRSELVELIEKERESGVFLTVLGVGTGNIKDATMEQLADHGNGNYAYLDTRAEARKVLIEEAGGTLITVAKDVKIQVEFNPSKVSAYRLIGYENRRLRDKDFNDDKKDAGEIGAGHSVTALYEIVPAGSKSPTPDVDPLRYQQPHDLAALTDSDEILTVKLRYKQPLGSESRLLSVAVEGEAKDMQAASDNFRFAAAVATFGMVLGNSEDRGQASFDMAQSMARSALGTDANGYRAEFVRLVAMARSLQYQG
jgi:Ca-activated chloride channel family protein